MDITYFLQVIYPFSDTFSLMINYMISSTNICWGQNTSYSYILININFQSLCYCNIFTWIVFTSDVQTRGFYHLLCFSFACSAVLLNAGLGCGRQLSCFELFVQSTVKLQTAALCLWRFPPNSASASPSCWLQPTIWRWCWTDMPTCTFNLIKQ